MPHPLQNRVESVRRKARRHWSVGTACACLRPRSSPCCSAFACSTTCCGCRMRAPGGSCRCSGLALIGWAGGGFSDRRCAIATGLVQVAQRIEQLFPQLGQRLSSAMDFLAQDESDPTAGSADLRRAVVAEAEAQSIGTRVCPGAGSPAPCADRAGSSPWPRSAWPASWPQISARPAWPSRGWQCPGAAAAWPRRHDARVREAAREAGRGRRL